MPLALMKYRIGPVRPQTAVVLAEALPEVIAAALHCAEPPEANLKPEEVEVWVEQFTPGVINNKDISLVILTSGYPERMANLDERRVRIADAIRTLLIVGGAREVSFSVCIYPIPNLSYGEY